MVLGGCWSFHFLLTTPEKFLGSTVMSLLPIRSYAYAMQTEQFLSPFSFFTQYRNTKECFFAFLASIKRRSYMASRQSWIGLHIVSTTYGLQGKYSHYWKVCQCFKSSRKLSKRLEVLFHSVFVINYHVHKAYISVFQHFSLILWKCKPCKISGNIQNLTN